MLSVVLDANQFVSAALVPGSNSWKVLDAARQGKIQLLVSPAVIEEVGRVFHYPKLIRRHGLPPEAIDRFLQAIWGLAVSVSASETVAIIQDDESDNRYLECAVAGDADYIVSGDRHLLALKSFRGIRIVDPASFLVLLEYGQG